MTEVTSNKLAPCLWFDTEAEAAAQFYTSIFPNSSMGETTYYTEAGKEFHGKEAGSVMTVAFVIAGMDFTALNGGPLFQFNEAISFQILCEDQAEIDYFWEKLTAGGDPKAQQCGWLKDKFGLSWQVAPRILPQMLKDFGPEKSAAVMQALLSMKKLDMEQLQQAGY